MIRKLVTAIVLAAAATILLTGCAKTKIVHCDRCGKEITLSADSRITEDWTVFCTECEEEIGPIVNPD